MTAVPRICLLLNKVGKMGQINQFPAESNWTAVVNDKSLDIVEEDEFLEFVTAAGHDRAASLKTLAWLFDAWRAGCDPLSLNGPNLSSW